MSASRRQASELYGSAAWKKRRAAQLREHPLCTMCEQRGRVTPATVADHVTPHSGDPVAFFEGKLQSLCKTCHDSTKQRLEKSGRMLGCDESGVPLDPTHPWNQTHG
jgi:5-methylcytosine-specific restriction endonuclease McrA